MAEWPPKVQKVLTKLHDRRENGKNKLDNAIDNRDAWLQELRQMPKERTKERLSRCADLVEALEEIKYRRYEIAQCENKTQKIIGEADQGKFDFAVDEDADIETKQMYFRQLAKDPAPKVEEAGDATKNPLDKSAA